MSEKDRLDRYSKEIVDSVFEKIKKEDTKLIDNGLIWFDELPPEEVIFESYIRSNITLKTLGITIDSIKKDINGKLHVDLRFDSPDFKDK